MARYEAEYDEIVANGRKENKKTQGKYARKDENALLNRLEKYKRNHLLFLHDFRIPFSNNMSLCEFLFYANFSSHTNNNQCSYINMFA